MAATTEVLTVNRSDLAWALNACIPHTGPANKNLDWVGFADDGKSIQVFATDGYTCGVASIWPVDGRTKPRDFYLSASEAKDLLVFMRPHRKHEHEQEVELLVAVAAEDGSWQEAEGNDPTLTPELHVAILQANMNLSEVYAVRQPGLSIHAVQALIEKVKGHDEGIINAEIYEPDTFAKFAKAKRVYGDRLTVQPAYGERYGAAYVTVGDNFVGSIAGLTWQEVTATQQPVEGETA